MPTPTFNVRFKIERYLWMKDGSGRMEVLYCCIKTTDTQGMHYYAFPVVIVRTNENPWYIKWRGQWINETGEAQTLKSVYLCGNTSARQIQNAKEVEDLYQAGKREDIELCAYDYPTGEEPVIQPDQSMTIIYQLNFQ